MRIIKSKRAAGLLTAVLLFGMFCLLRFCVEAYTSLADLAWSDFYAAKNPDTIFVGTSSAERAFDPVAFDAEAARVGERSHSFNLATPSQPLFVSLESVKAAHARGVKRVYLGLGYLSFCYPRDLRAELTYARGRYQGDPFGELSFDYRAFATSDSFDKGQSLSLLFPWVYTPVQGLGQICENIGAKLGRANKAEFLEKTIADWKYKGQGYGNYTNQDAELFQHTTLDVDGKPAPSAEAFADFEELCHYCRQQQIQLFCVVLPHTIEDTLALAPQYKSVMEHARELASREGAQFFDCNMWRDQAFCRDAANFSNYEHLSFEGAESLSRYVAAHADELGDADFQKRECFAYDEFSAWEAQARKDER